MPRTSKAFVRPNIVKVHHLSKIVWNTCRCVFSKLIIYVRVRIAIINIIGFWEAVSLVAPYLIIRWCIIINMNENVKKTIITLSVAIVVIVGLVLVWRAISAPKAEATPDESTAVEAVANPAEIISARSDNGGIADSVKGNSGAKVVIVEYGDYQCPACSSASQLVTGIIGDYLDDVAFVFRNYPLSFHANAVPTAKAAEAAGFQGSLWRMYEYLYGMQNQWSELDSEALQEFLDGLVAYLGLDTEKFWQDYNSTAVMEKVQFDYGLGQKQAITGTPSFFINGKDVAVEIWSDEAKFRELIEAEIAKVQ